MAIIFKYFINGDRTNEITRIKHSSKQGLRKWWHVRCGQDSVLELIKSSLFQEAIALSATGCPGAQAHTSLDYTTPALSLATEAGECPTWGAQAWGWGAAEIKLAAAGKSEGRGGLPVDSSAS